MSDYKAESEADMTDRVVEVEMPVWMLKQLRGTARHERDTAITKFAEDDADKIFRLLDHHYQQIDTEDNNE